jgi:dihydrofolate reductase
MRVVVINHLTLDGVMQSPGRPDEDTRGGFEHGGWAAPNVDDVVNAAMGARMPRSGGLLLGRRSYEGMLGYWNTTDSPFRRRSTTPTSTSLQDIARAAAVAELDPP